MKIIVRLFLVVFLVLVLVSDRVSAQYGQPAPKPVYLLIDKFVAYPNKTKGGNIEYVDNLSVSDPHYQVGQIVRFRINVINNSDVKLTKVIVKDILPDYLELVSGGYRYDKDQNIFYIDVGDLDPYEKRVFFVDTKVRANKSIDKRVYCLVNKVEAFLNDSKKDEDTSQFCVDFPLKKAPVKVKTMPKTGSESLLLFSGVSLISLGFALRKKFS